MIYVLFSWSFLEILHEPFLCNFLCCTAASGPYLVANRKALILDEHNIDHCTRKIFKHFKTSYLQNEAVNELKDNFISPETTSVSLS